MCSAESKLLLALLVAGIGSLAFFHKRGLRYLQFFQQEEYEGARFLAWFWRVGAFDRRGTLACLLAALLSYMLESTESQGNLLTAAFGSLTLIWLANREDDPTTGGKITLKMTERATRIYRVAFLLYGILDVAAAGAGYFFPTPVSNFFLFQIPLIQISALLIVAANALLSPKEKKLQEGFAEDARRIVEEVKPTIIGITGSYGKTSTKVILTDILSAVGPTFSTPRSINSYMGMTREIRERMRSGQKFAVIEMGAYHIGSIRRMCTLTPPKAGIITAIGEMHLERFGSPENVFKAKSELAEAIPEDGILVVNGDNELCRKVAAEHKKRLTLLYGLEPEKGHLDALMCDIEPTHDGTNFTIQFQGREFKGFTKLLGKPMLSNILASFTMACALGLAPELVIAAIRHVKTESNRLEPVKASIGSFAGNGRGRMGQVLRLNDAYNSNPIGFAAALDVLAAQRGGRKVLVTPGMIELGEKQYEENHRAAKKAAAVCDLVAVVGTANREALLEGLKAGGFAGERIKQFADMKAALAFLGQEYFEDGDVVLIENDLPDLYESNPKF